MHGCVQTHLLACVFVRILCVCVCVYGACELYNLPWSLILPQGITQEGDEESRRVQETLEGHRGVNWPACCVVISAHERSYGMNYSLCEG